MFANLVKKCPKCDCWMFLSKDIWIGKAPSGIPTQWLCGCGFSEETDMYVPANLGQTIIDLWEEINNKKWTYQNVL